MKAVVRLAGFNGLGIERWTIDSNETTASRLGTR
jgi:hypothetical protein